MISSLSGPAALRAAQPPSALSCSRLPVTPALPLPLSLLPPPPPEHRLLHLTGSMSPVLLEDGAVVPDGDCLSLISISSTIIM